MKRAVFLFACLSATALACDIKPGYLAHGLIRDTLKMEPLCSLGDAMKSQVPGSKWAEVWGTTNDQAGKLKIAYVMSALELKGFKLLTKRPAEKGQVFGYVRGNETVVLLTGVNDPLIFLAITGK